jgi:hypothetical protein
MADLCPYRRIAFTAAACSRARYVFAICHGATPLSTVDRAMADLWKGLALDDMDVIAAVYRPLTEVPESNVDDTLDSDWMAWLALAAFEFPAALPEGKRPLQVLAQSSSWMLTVMGELDLRLGFNGPPREGRLATMEWAAQERCLEILAADPLSPEIPVEDLEAAGRQLGGAIADSTEALAAATGWRLWPAVR